MNAPKRPPRSKPSSARKIGDYRPLPTVWHSPNPPTDKPAPTGHLEVKGRSILFTNSKPRVYDAPGVNWSELVPLVAPDPLSSQAEGMLVRRLRSLAPKAFDDLHNALTSPIGVPSYVADIPAALLLVEKVILEAASSLASVSRPQRFEKLHEHVSGAATQPSKDPLQAARDRGINAAVQEWLKPENLTLRDAATYAGRSDRMINEDRQKGRLYALVLPGKERGFRYPMWQFNADPDRLAAALTPFISANASCWVVHSSMQRQEEPLDNMRAMDWVLDHHKPIDRLVHLVEARYCDEQGAA